MFRLSFSVVLLLLTASWARAADLPPRVVVLDERSPNLGIVAAVRDAYADEIAALPPEGQKAYLMDLVATLTTSWQTQTIGLNATAAITTGQDQLVASVASDLDLAAGAYVVAMPGSVLGTGIVRLPGSEVQILPTLPPDSPEPPDFSAGICDMPTVTLYPSVTNGAGLSRRRVSDFLKVNTTTCAWLASSKMEASRNGGIRGSTRRIDIGARAVPYVTDVNVMASSSNGDAGASGVFPGCVRDLWGCGGPGAKTNHFARLKARVYTAWGGNRDECPRRIALAVERLEGGLRRWLPLAL